MSVSAASAGLDILMRKRPLYNFVQLTIIGGMCSASICSVSFSGSFIDCLASAPLGALLVAIQLIGARNELYANVFEITIATLLSFLSAALASTKHFCYSAVASSSVVLILPVSSRRLVVVTTDENAYKGFYRSERVPRDFVAFFGCRSCSIMFRLDVLPFPGLWACDRSRTVRKDYWAGGCWSDRLCVLNIPRSCRTVVAANAKPVVGVFDSADVFALPELETDGSVVEERNGGYL